jgi:hypothetical protein
VGLTTLPCKKENCLEASKKFSQILWRRPRQGVEPRKEERRRRRRSVTNYNQYKHKVTVPAAIIAGKKMGDEVVNRIVLKASK